MQRISPNTMPPRGSGNRPGSSGGSAESPAFRMASRIRAEQGPERAAQYLRAMEPFLAPAERSHIAQQLGLRLPTPPPPPAQPAPPAVSNPPAFNGMPGLSNMQNLGAMSNMGPLGNIGNIMQMMQLFQGLSGGNGGGNAGGNPLAGLGGGNPMQLAQMLGGLMGGKKN